MSDEDGLVCAYVLDGKGGGRELDWSGIRAWRPGDGVRWVHLDRAGEVAKAWLREEAGIDLFLADAMLADESRPRVLRDGDAVMLNLRGVNLNPNADPDDMVSVRMWIDQDQLITVRRRRLMAISDLSAAIADGKGPSRAGQFVVQIANRLIDRMGPTIADLDETIDTLEERVMTGDEKSSRVDLAKARQAAISLRRYLSPQRDALSRLQSEQVSWLTELDHALLRETADRTIRYVEDLDAGRERAAVVQDQLNYQMSERMNRTMYVLTVFAAILLPPGLITGLLGINVGGMPGVDSEMSFWVVVGLIGVIAAIEILVLRKLRWI
jgi:zinc transporter